MIGTKSKKTLDNYALRSSIRLSRMSVRGKNQLAVGGFRDSGFVLEDSKVSMMVKLIQEAEGDPEKQS